MAPPISSRSTLGSRLRMTSILPLILAPPRMATNGRRGSARARPRYSSSRSISSPATAGLPCARMTVATPAVDACARCAAPNASFTNTSPSAAICSASAWSFFSSPGRKRVFSSSSTSPSYSIPTAVRASPPAVSRTKRTVRPSSSSSSRSATGLSDMDGSGLPLGRPKCAMRMTLAPCCSSASSVGSVLVMRVSSVICPDSSSGTL
jgi:hypothetical protein